VLPQVRSPEPDRMRVPSVVHSPTATAGRPAVREGGVPDEGRPARRGERHPHPPPQRVDTLGAIQGDLRPGRRPAPRGVGASNHPRPQPSGQPSEQAMVGSPRELRERLVTHRRTKRIERTSDCLSNGRPASTIGAEGGRLWPNGSVNAISRDNGRRHRLRDPPRGQERKTAKCARLSLACRAPPA
jgi:hypothetical protein